MSGLHWLKGWRFGGEPEARDHLLLIHCRTSFSALRIWSVVSVISGHSGSPSLALTLEKGRRPMLTRIKRS